MLCPVAALLTLPAEASPFVLGPERPVAEPGYGAVAESFAAVIPKPGGFTAYTNDLAHNVLIATPVSPSGVPDVAARHIVGPASAVAVSKGDALLFWPDGRFVYSARVGNQPNIVAETRNRLRHAACNDEECLVALDGAYPFQIVVTDLEGKPKTDALRIPTPFYPRGGITTLVPHPGGFTILQGGGFLEGQQLMRVDLQGKVLWTSWAPQITSGVMWNGDHIILLTQSVTTGAFAGVVDVDDNGTLTTVRPFPTPSAPAAFTRRGDRFVLAVRNAEPNYSYDLYDVDAMWTTARRIQSFTPDAPFYLAGLIATDSALIAQLSANGALATTGIEPATHATLLSAGRLSQQAVGIAGTSAGDAVVWTETDLPYAYRLHAAHFAHDGTLIDRVLIAADAARTPLPMRAAGDDILIFWYDHSLRPRGAVLHPGGTADNVELDPRWAIREIVARADDWIAIEDNDLDPPSAIRITRAGFVFPPKSIPTSALAADSDGRSVFIYISGEIVLLNTDLAVARRIPGATASYLGAVAFSRASQSYLLADGAKLTQFDRDGNALSSAPFPATTPLRLAGTSWGWVVASGSTITSVLPGNPLIVEPGAAVPNWAAIAAYGDRVRILTTRAVEAHGLISTQLFVRELSLGDGVRRRSVVSR
jgi:hypothetical protein